jgi:hypothetical protein
MKAIFTFLFHLCIAFYKCAGYHHRCAFQRLGPGKVLHLDAFLFMGDWPMTKISLQLLGKSNLALPGFCLILQKTRARES